jgi:integrase
VARTAATERAYAADWSRFDAWCQQQGVLAFPAAPATVVRYVDELAASRKVSTLRRLLAAVRAAHVDRGCWSPTSAPTVRLAVARAEWHQRGSEDSTRPVEIDELRRMSNALPVTLAGARDRALLLIGYGAGLRPGELTALEARHVRLVSSGLCVSLRHRRVVIPFGSTVDVCAVRAWKRWRSASRVSDGPAFRAVDRHGRVGSAALNPKAVTRVVRRAAAAAELDPARYRGLSLRRGVVPAATEHRVSDERIMAQTGHRSRRLVRRYMHQT